MKTTIEEEGKEGDEPKFEEIDEDTVFEEKKTEKVKEVSHEWENVPVIMQRCCGVSATVKVPQIQFIAESEDLPVVQQRWGRTVRTVQLAAWCGVWRWGRR